MVAFFADFPSEREKNTCCWKSLSYSEVYNSQITTLYKCCISVIFFYKLSYLILYILLSVRYSTQKKTHFNPRHLSLDSNKEWHQCFVHNLLLVKIILFMSEIYMALALSVFPRFLQSRHNECHVFQTRVSAHKLFGCCSISPVGTFVRQTGTYLSRRCSYVLWTCSST